MKKTICFAILTGLLLFTACKQSEAEQNRSITDTTSQKNSTIVVSETQKKPEDFLPKGFMVFDKKFGDLNKDGLDDCILIIKGTNKENIIQHEYRGELDRNRRGIIVLFKKNDSYELAVKNYDCFSSENEEGGVYYAPELDVYP